jgi:hypothetical protein
LLILVTCFCVVKGRAAMQPAATTHSPDALSHLTPLSPSQAANLGRRQLAQAADAALKGAECIGADTLLQLLKNYTRSADLKTAITVGVVGLPNVGKSSVINSLKRTRVAQVRLLPAWLRGGALPACSCTVPRGAPPQRHSSPWAACVLLSSVTFASVPPQTTKTNKKPKWLPSDTVPHPAPAQVGNTPGVTKAVQEIHLDRHLTLLDSPGVVFADAGADGAAAAALRNAVKAEQLEDPALPVRCRAATCTLCRAVPAAPYRTCCAVTHGRALPAAVA